MGVNTLQNQILRGHPLLFFPFPALSRDYVAIIAGVQRIDGPLQIKCWGVRTPVALTPCMHIRYWRRKETAW